MKVIKLGGVLSSILKKEKEHSEKAKEEMKKLSLGLGDPILRKITKNSEKVVVMRSPFRNTKREMAFKTLSLGEINQKTKNGKRESELQETLYWKKDPLEKIEKIDQQITMFLHETEEKLKAEQMKQIK